MRLFSLFEAKKRPMLF